MNPLSDSNFVPSTEPSGVGIPVIHFPSPFDPNPQTSDDMPIQRQSIDIGSVLGTSVPQSSGTSLLSPPPGFSEVGDVMRKKRKWGEEDGDEDQEQSKLSPTEPLKAKSPSKKGKSKSS